MFVQIVQIKIIELYKSTKMCVNTTFFYIKVLQDLFLCYDVIPNYAMLENSIKSEIGLIRKMRESERV